MTGSTMGQLRDPRLTRPGTFLVIAPLSIIDDELRMARLEEYLNAAFPEATIVMAEENMLPGNQSGVAVMVGNGDGEFDHDNDRLSSEISAAMHDFVDQKRPIH